MVVCYSAIYIVAISFEPISYRAMGQPISIFKVLFIEKNILCNFIPSKVNLCSLNSTQADLPTITHSIFIITSAKPRVSLTVPNCDYFKRVSLTVLDTFLDAIAKAKKLICKTIAQNLKRVSLTKSFLALAMAFNLLLSNLTQPQLPKLKNLFVSETGNDILTQTESCETFLSVARG